MFLLVSGPCRCCVLRSWLFDVVLRIHVLSWALSLMIVYTWPFSVAFLALGSRLVGVKASVVLYRVV